MSNNQVPSLKLTGKKYLIASLIGCVLVILIPNLVSQDASNLASSFGSIFVSAVVTLLSVVLLLKSNLKNSLGKISVMLVAYASFSFIAETLWVVYEHVLNIEPFPSIADFFWLSGYAFLFLFLSYYLKPVKKFITKTVVLFAVITSVIFLIPSILLTFDQNAGANEFEFIVALAYPIADALLLGPLVIGVILFFKVERNVLWSMFLLAVVCYTVGDTFFLALSINDSYYTGHPMDVLYLSGYTFFAFGIYNNIKLFKKYEVYWQYPTLGAETVIDTVKFEKINRFVIPFILGTIILVATIVWLNFFYFGMSSENASGATYLFYIVVGVLGAFSIIIIVINYNLMKLVKIRTQELQSERDNLEKQVREKTLEVVKAEKLSTIGELASSLGHDLRNPLTVIKSTFDIMKVKSKDKMDQNTLRHYELIDHALSRIIQMVTDMLNFVRVSPLKTEDQSITSIIKSVTSKIQVPDTIKINLPDNNIIIKCDSKKLEIIFVNLITNAIEAIESKGQIDIRFIDKNDCVLIDIEDSGPGIPENILPKIFDPLFTTKQTGTGLGLPSCRNMIEQHGGIIMVKTNPTIFTIKLPKDPNQSKFLI